MKPSWDKLMKKYAGHASALVADVDCTADGKPLCEEHGVQGFPTIKWGDPSALEDYSGGRDYKELKKFADENLKPLCSVANIDLCDADKRKQIEAYQAMPTSELSEKVEEIQTKMKAAETTFEEELKKLQERYEELQKEKEAKVTELKG